MDSLLSVSSILVGFVGLIWSAEKFVLGASTTAKNLGVSPLIIGLTIVAFGTSAPEIFTSAVASLKGVPELAIGNALGSNIANIGLVLSITALVCPVAIPLSLLKQELPILLFVTFSVFFMFQDGTLNRIDGIILVIILIIFVWRLIANQSKNSKSTANQPPDDEISEFIAEISTFKALSLMLIGLGLMILSSNLLVFGAKNIATALGVSELIIGLTVVAIGTSLPELAASVTSALKGHHELALGNIIGSNIFNILLVLPVPAFMAPLSISSHVLWRDYTSMLVFTLLLAVFLFIQAKNNKKIGRKLGAVLLTLYLSYTAILFFTQ